MGIEEVEAAVGALVLLDRLGQPFDQVHACRGVVQVGQEGQIAPIGGQQQGAQGGQTVDGLLHGRQFDLAGAITMFHRAVVRKEGDVVDRRLDAQDQGLLVVELDGDGSHVMLDAGAFDAGVEVIAQLVLEVAGELVPQEGSHIGRLDGMDGCAH